MNDAGRVSGCSLVAAAILVALAAVPFAVLDVIWVAVQR